MAHVYAPWCMVARSPHRGVDPFNSGECFIQAFQGYAKVSSNRGVSLFTTPEDRIAGLTLLFTKGVYCEVYDAIQAKDRQGS